DVFVMPSLAESFGLMAIEAMAAMRPVICFDGTAVATTTFAPECGLAVPSGDALALRLALDELAHNPEERTRRGALGRKIVAQAYDHEVYVQALVGLYRAVLEDKRARARFS